MMTIDGTNKEIERFDPFVESEPRICVWCRYCGVVRRDDSVWGYVCIRSCEDISKRVNNAIKPFPVQTGGTRTRLQCVDADEMHDCFMPTKRDDRRISLLDELGLLGDWRKALMWQKK